MKKYLNIINVFIGINCVGLFLLIYTLTSCNDSGVTTPSSFKSGRFVVSETGLAPLIDSINGLYQLWLLQDSSNVTLYYHISTFNMNGRGNFIDANGNPATFNYTGDTNYLTRSTDLLLTVEPGTGGPIPGPIHLISTSLYHTPDSITGTLTLSGTLALGSVGATLMQGTNAKYTLQAPTSPNQANCLKGLWFCDGNGSTLIPAGLQLNTNSPLVYQGWVADTTNPGSPVYYSMGRFYNPYAADNDGAGPCAGPNQGWDKPGQDWVQNGCQMPDLNEGHHQVFITLEPANEVPGTTAYNTPFFLKVFWQSHIAGACKQIDPYFFNQSANFPTLHVLIEK